MAKRTRSASLDESIWGVTVQTEYETHYAKEHSNRCSECRRNFPTPHLLGLHIAENHDPIIAAKRERGDKIFTCLVEGCEKVCRDWKKRRMHLIDKHGFPRNYDFFIVNSGVDGKRSMLRPGVDAQGHRASSRERDGSSESANEMMATPSTTPSVTSSVTPATLTDQQLPLMPAPPPPAVPVAAPRVLGRNKRSASTRSISTGGAMAPTPAKSDDRIADITSSMSALKMVPRIVAEKQRARQT